MHPAWPGFRPLRISRIDQESRTVFSLILTSPEGRALASPLPGQFIVVRLQPVAGAAPLLRSYSLSTAPDADHYRISVKREEHGAASTYWRDGIRVGDSLEVSAPKGAFTLRSDERPVVLVSVGIGITPVLAMLHSLATARSTREIWWLHGARNAAEHPFARESDELLRQLPRSYRFIVYSRASASESLDGQFDASGHLGPDVLIRLGAPREADFYLCGPAPFLKDLTRGLLNWGVPQSRVRSEISGAGGSSTPGIVEERPPPHAWPQGDVAIDL